MIGDLDHRAATVLAPRLWVASLLVCGLFIAEDPVVIAVRSRWTAAHVDLLVDLGLATAMVAYNYVASRYVVSIAAADRILQAMEQVDARRDLRIANIGNRTLRRARRLLAYLNPFDLIKRLGDRMGRTVDRVGASVRQQRLHRMGSVLEDLGAVNVLGVPGAGLALGTSGHVVSRWQSLRHSLLFVASWFIGANVIEASIGWLHGVPGLGRAVEALTGLVGSVFALVTDVTRPVGAIAVGMLVAAVVRYTTQVEATIRSASAGAPVD